MGLNLDNRALPGVLIGVVMGRHAGFLTAAGALPTLHDRYGISTSTMGESIKAWLR